MINTQKLAGTIHLLTSEAFNNIGDKGRSVLSEMDAGIDYASAAAASTSTASSTTSNKKKTMMIDPTLLKQAETILMKAIDDTTGIRSRKTDIELLQHIIVKEGES